MSTQGSRQVAFASARSEILDFEAFCYSGNLFQTFSRIVLEVSWETPKTSQKTATFFEDWFDWTTGAPHDGYEWKKYGVVPCAHPSRTLLSAYFNSSENKAALSFPGGRGIASVVRWNLRPVIFGVEFSSFLSTTPSQGFPRCIWPWPLWIGAWWRLPVLILSSCSSCLLVKVGDRTAALDLGEAKEPELKLIESVSASDVC